MKLKKVKQSDITAGLVDIAGTGLGFMSANGLANAYAKVDDEAVMTEDQKKKKLHVAIGCAFLGGFLAVALDGSDTITKAVKSVGVGLSAGGIKGVVTHFAKDEAQTTLTAGTTTKRFVAGALGCPCESTQTPPITYLPAPNMALSRPSLRQVMPMPRSVETSRSADVYSNFSLSA